MCATVVWMAGDKFVGITSWHNFCIIVYIISLGSFSCVAWLSQIQFSASFSFFFCMFFVLFCVFIRSGKFVCWLSSAVITEIDCFDYITGKVQPLFEKFIAPWQLQKIIIKCGSLFEIFLQFFLFIFEHFLTRFLCDN